MTRSSGRDQHQNSSTLAWNVSPSMSQDVFTGSRKKFTTRPRLQLSTRVNYINQSFLHTTEQQRSTTDVLLGTVLVRFEVRSFLQCVSLEGGPGAHAEFEPRCQRRSQRPWNHAHTERDGQDSGHSACSGRHLGAL